MPLYEYECQACHHRFEQIQRYSDPLVKKCPACGKKKVKKLLSSPAIQFKGTGWYITDYARKSADGKDTKGTKEGGESKEAKETKDTKSESTAKSDSAASTPTSTSSSSTSSSGSKKD